MRFRSLFVVVLVLCCSIGLVAARYLRSVKQPTSEKAVVTRDPLLASFADYKKWTLVNPVPLPMEPAAAIDCFHVIGREENSPHLHKYISVYVNDAGRDAMMTQKTPRFPVGSMVVKEKFGSKTSTTPEILTAMVKREQGYNTVSGDWEFVVLSGAADAIIERGKLATCQTCHLSYRHSDFVTRTYLPDAVLQKLK